MNTVKDCALIPAYNEEATISEIVTKIKKVSILPIVIDDNSTDRTSELAKKSGAIVIKQSSNRGKGEALRSGINYVLDNKPKIENLIFIDADMQYQPEQATLLLEPLKKKEADIVMGFRDWSTVPFRHRLGNLVWRSAFNLMFGTKLKDTNCGFISVTRDTAKVLKDAMYGGYIIENAMLSHAIKNNLRIKQVPVNVSYNRKSKVSRGVRIVSGITFFILRKGLEHRLGKK